MSLLSVFHQACLQVHNAIDAFQDAPRQLNDPDQTQGFIKKFLMTKSFNINDLSRQINVYKNEGDFYEF